MPTKRTRLTIAEQTHYRANAQQLLARGLISHIPESLKAPPVLDILLDELASEVSETLSGQSFYAVWVQLVARQAGLILANVRITTRWDGEICLASDEVEVLCGPRGPVNALDGVLNERIENGIRFRCRGDMVRGTILAWGLRPIPDAYCTDAMVPFELTLIDSLGNQLGGEGALRVNRLRKSEQKIQGAKETLFDGAPYESIGEKTRRNYILAIDAENAGRLDTPEGEIWIGGSNRERGSQSKPRSQVVDEKRGG
jgi:hypothetical protein